MGRRPLVRPAPVHRRDRHRHRHRRRLPRRRHRRAVPRRLGDRELHDPAPAHAHGTPAGEAVRTRTISSPRRSPRLPSRPAAITALQLAYLAWAAVTLARGRAGDALALVVVFAVLQVPRMLRLPGAFDVAFL